MDCWVTWCSVHISEEEKEEVVEEEEVEEVSLTRLAPLFLSAAPCPLLRNQTRMKENMMREEEEEEGEEEEEEEEGSSQWDHSTEC